MNKQVIPAPIAAAATSMLAPYHPGLTPEQLEVALTHPDKEQPPDRLRSREETSEALHVSMPTLDRMLASGQLCKVKIRGRVFIRESEIRALIEGEVRND